MIYGGKERSKNRVVVPGSRFLGFLKVEQLCTGILEHSIEARNRVGIGVALARLAT
jgi:hypothetical protein